MSLVGKTILWILSPFTLSSKKEEKVEKKLKIKSSYYPEDYPYKKRT